MNDFSCTLRITATERRAANVSVRRHQFAVGAPIEFDVEADRVASIEYALGAVGAEIVNGLQAFARRRRIQLDQIEAVVTGEVQHALTYLEVVGESGRPRIARIRVKVYVASFEDEATVRQLWEHTLARLPLVGTLERAVPLEMELTLTP